MKKFTVVLFVLMFVQPAFADFKLNLKKDALLDSMDITTVKDLVIGDSAYIKTTTAVGNICKMDNGKLAISQYALVERKRSDSQDYVVVSLEPGRKINMQAAPAIGSTNKRPVVRTLLSKLGELPNCRLLETFGVGKKKEVLEVTEIEKVSSAKELLELYEEMMGIKKEK